MNTPTPMRPRAGIFLRLLLSHLLVVLTCFVAGVVLFSWLFGPGVRYFLMHTPLVLVPVVLVLIGIAGLLAVWTAASITDPLEHLSEALGGDHPFEELSELDPSQQSAESAQLLERILTLAPAGMAGRHSATGSSHNPLLVDIDRDGTVLTVTSGIARLMQAAPTTLTGRSFVEVFHSGSGAAELEIELRGHMATGVSHFEFTTRVAVPAGVPMDVRWEAIAARDVFGRTGRWMLRMEEV